MNTPRKCPTGDGMDLELINFHILKIRVVDR